MIPYILNFSLFLLTLFTLGCNSPEIGICLTPEPQKTYDIQIYHTDASEAKKITPKSIERVFESLSLDVVANNNMNRPFKPRFKKLHYKIYNLAIFMNDTLTFKLLKKYPSFGVLTPLTMSIWQEEDGSMNISTLSIHGISRAANIPLDDPDLIAYSALIEEALKKAMPQGSYVELEYSNQSLSTPLAITYSTEVLLDESQTPQEYIEDFEAEFEGEMEPLGFLFPYYTDVQEEIFDQQNYKGIYDYYHTYSICKFDVIYATSKNHPEVGAWAPCSFYLYKKHNEKEMHIGFLSVENWINSTNMKEYEEGAQKLREAQTSLKKVIRYLTVEE